jgi:lysophospholipase L1-like esterase
LSQTVIAMPSRVLGYWGLVRPYRFDRLLCLVSAGALAVLVLLYALYCALTGELVRYTPRDTYFVYLLTLVLAGAALAPWPRLAALPLALAIIDLSLGAGSLALKKSGLAFHSVMPRNYNEDQRFEWHPLLQAVPIPSISVDVVGHRMSHSSAGTRGRDYTREELSRKSLVAAFGGSATYDIAVSDEDTWVNRLERTLGSDDFAVINHGVPGYSTVEHVIQTAFYADAFGVKPTCALYYIGWNDIRNAHIEDLDPGYARFHLRTLVDGLEVRRYGAGYRSISPLFTVAARLVSRETQTIRPPELRGAPKSGGDPVLESLYRRNAQSISMINRGRGIRTVWIGQILNLDALNDDKIYGWLPLVHDRDVWPLLSRFNAELRDEAGSLGDPYIDVSPADFTSDDFVDQGHFSEAGALTFARMIAPQVADACRR